MILKYTHRLIKSTLNRFIAILAIVFIGVSFMMGLRSNYNIMQNSVEKYYDDEKLYDIQIYSNYGFDDNDVKALNDLDYIEDVFASKSRDLNAKLSDTSGIVVRLLEIDSNLNGIELKEGRMPEKENECLAVIAYNSGDLKIGDAFTIYSDTEELSESFKNTTYTIVGTVKSVENMGETFSTSTLDNKTLDTVVYIPNSNFIREYYSTLYLTIDGARDLFSFSNEYKNLIEEKEELLENFTKEQSQSLRNKIVSEAKEELDKAKTELEENRTKYQKELDDGKAKLNDAKKQLDDALEQIQTGEEEIPKAKVKLEQAKKDIIAGEATLKQKEKDFKDGVAEFKSTYGYEISELESLAKQIYGEYAAKENEIASYENQIKEITETRNYYQNIINNSGCSSASDAKQRRNVCDPSTPEGQEKIEFYNNVIDAFEYIRIHGNDANQYVLKINAAQQELRIIDIAMQQAIGMNTKDGYNFIMGKISEMRQYEAQISQGWAEIESGKIAIQKGEEEIKANENKLEKGKIDYQNGLVEYQKGVKEYEDGVKEFNKKMQDAEDEIADAEDKIKDLENAEWYLLKRYNSNYSTYMYSNTCDQMKSIGTIIPLLFFVVAALVCSTTMTRLIDEQRGQIGIYRALGFTKKEIIEIYLLYVILASLAASVVAVFIGVLIYPTIIYNTWRLLYDLPNIILSIRLDNLLICVSCFTLLMMLVTYIVINKTLVENPSQLLRPKAPKSTKQIILEKFTWLWRKLPFTSKVTARNLLRYKVRFIMTVIGVAGCTSLLLMGFGIKDSISSVVKFQYSDINQYNYLVEVKNDRHIDSMIEDIQLDKNNETYAPYMAYQTQIDLNDKETSFYINVFKEENQSKLFNLKNSNNKKAAIVGNEGIFISDKYAKENNLNVGDTLLIESSTGIEKEVTIAARVENYIGNVIYMSESYYKDIFNEEIEYTTIGVKNTTDSSNLLKLANQYKDIKNIGDFSDSINRFDDMFEALNLIILVIIVVAGALAFVVLINLTNVNISERIREIATLKVLGFREREVDSYIFKEVMLMSVVGAIIGLPLGYIEEGYIMNVINMDLCCFPHVVHPISYLYAVVITIIFTVIVLLITRRTLRKVQMVESLKSIE